MDKLKEWLSIAKLLWFVWGVSIFLLLIIVDNEYYIIKPDKDYLFDKLRYIFIIICIIEIIHTNILSEKRKIPYISLSFIFLYNSFYLSYVAHLKYSNTLYITRNASIVDDYEETHFARHGKRKYHYHTLRFSDKELISEKEISKQVFSDMPIKKNDCLMIKYRENAWLIELRPIENLGKMSINECWETIKPTQTFRLPENIIIDKLQKH